MTAEMTMRPVHIVGLGGSLDSDSSSLVALRLALAGARESGAQTRLLDLRELDLPLYVHGMTPPAGARRLAEATTWAHGMVWSSPLYHGTISGAMKNVLDWLELLSTCEPPYLTDKVVGLVATAGGVQGLQAINTMEYVVRSLRGFTLPLTAPISRAHHAFDAEGRAVDPLVAGLLHRLGAELVRAAVRFAPPLPKAPAEDVAEASIEGEVARLIAAR